jgi:tetratricopeptide (TPR) repeat protein
MKKTLSSLVLFGLLATGSIAYAQSEINACWKFEDAKDYKKAIDCLKKNLEIYEKHGDYENAATTKIDIGDIYRKMKDFKSAEKYLFEGLEGFKKLEDKGNSGDIMGIKEEEANAYWYIGRLYKDKGDKNTARKYYERASDIFDSIGEDRASVEIWKDWNWKELKKSGKPK